MNKNLNDQIKKLEHVIVSIKNNSNLDILINKIKKELHEKFISHGDILITRERHRQHLEQCLFHLETFKEKKVFLTRTDDRYVSIMNRIFYIRKKSQTL